MTDQDVELTEDGFHPDADPDATVIEGDRPYGVWGQCTASKRDSSRCTQPAKGAHGKCHYHGGSEGSGPPEGNQNAVKHGAYAECNDFYQKVLSDQLRQLVDDIFEDYLDEYEEKHGEPSKGHETELFRISVTHVKDITLENWSTQRPDDLDSGHPLVDRETRVSQNGGRYYQYKETVVLAAQKKLSTDRRNWLKDLDLLHDAGQKTASALEEGIDLTLSSEEREALDSAFDVEPDT